MGSSVDFIYWLDPDMSHKILTCLDDPSDLVRVSCVSRSWRHYVIRKGLCKQLCLRMFPQLSRASYVVEMNKSGSKEPEVGSSYSMECQSLEKDHRVYAYLARACTSFAIVGCIQETIGASSTDNFPEESIDNTLDARDDIGGRASYWSSKGQKNPDVPETLTYKLVCPICVITEISVHPFQAFFQPGFPIYSAKSVRIKMGHPNRSLDTSADEKYVWTYISPEFPMAQENRLQKFKLPQPVLCIGRILQIELLGRIQRQEMDNLFYICVSHVQVVGRPLSPAFSVEIREPSSGTFLLKCDQLAKCPTQPAFSNESHAIPPDYVQRRIRDFQQIVTMLRENVVEVVEEEDWDEDEEVDDFEDAYAL
ncbi:F-box protein At4g00755 isoform X1 [Neltuma alba]|uniref:F-box protein At4g00755 isoform X1 n=1 Tax=Neltuma alba TaxID=207710 RepID=UPI0010A35F0A|nr:F-box protein At4g00755-like isoform X1 [Prosopis alba]XP_028769087.1 F-box protein At4g00755-like isoform X1 [Prosopis alba]XP_028769088.1 F-box protein At4g00755-like isoform X1 [Prosopis alba]